MTIKGSNDDPLTNFTLAKLDKLAQDSFARLNNKMVRASRKSRDFGTGELLSLAEIELIDCVVKKPDLSITLVAHELGITKSAVSQLASNLIHKGYLANVASPDHGKVRFLRPTKNGLVASRGLDQYRGTLSLHLKGVSKAELAAFLKVAERFEAFLNDITPQ